MNDKKKNFIVSVYALTIDKKPFYIGSTIRDIKNRLAIHISQAKAFKGNNRVKEEIIRDALENDVKIGVKELCRCECTVDDRIAIESFFIDYYNKQHKLVNNEQHTKRGADTHNTLKKKSKPLIVSKDGDKVWYPSRKEFAEKLYAEHDTSLSNIKSRITQAIKTNGYYKGYYIEDASLDRLQVYKENKLIGIYNNLVDVADACGLSVSGLRYAIQHNQPCKGFKVIDLRV